MAERQLSAKQLANLGDCFGVSDKWPRPTLERCCEILGISFAQLLRAAGLKGLSDSQRSILAAIRKTLYEPEALERKHEGQKAGGHAGGRSRPKPNSSEANLPQSKRAPQSREKAAKDMHVSPRSVQTAQKVVEDGVPDARYIALRGALGCRWLERFPSRVSD